MSPGLIQSLEPRLLLSTTDIAIVNPGFETLYQPGSTTVTATLPARAITEGIGPRVPVGTLADSSDVTVDYSDGTRGRFVSVPGWTVLPHSGSTSKPVAAVVNAPAAYGGKRDNFASILFPPGGAGTTRILQTLTGISLQARTSYVLSAQVADGGNIELQVGSKVMSPAHSTKGDKDITGFATLSRTYNIGAKSPQGDITVLLTNGRSTYVGSFDDVSLTATPTSDVPTPAPTPGGSTFGLVNGHRQKLKLTQPGGTIVTLSLTGGTGTATQVGDQIQLDITDAGPGAGLSITAKGGSGRVSLANVSVTGSLSSFKAPSADLQGTLAVTGSIGSATLGSISGKIDAASIKKIVAGAVSGTLYSNGSIQSLKLGEASGVIGAAGAIATIALHDVTGAKILSGVNFGADDLLGGVDAAADSYAPGSIGSIQISGAVTGAALIGAGVDPINGILGDGDDVAAGGASTIKRLSIQGTLDSGAVIETGAFGRVKLMGKAQRDLTHDPRFVMLR